MNAISDSIVRDRKPGLLRAGSAHCALLSIGTTQCSHCCTGHAVQNGAAGAAVCTERIARFGLCLLAQVTT